MIDAEFYEDEAIPPSWRDRLPDWLTAVGFKVRNDVLGKITHADSRDQAIEEVTRYLTDSGLHHLEPIQVSLLAGDSFLYHDWLRRLPSGLSPTPIAEITGPQFLYRTLRTVSRSDRGLCTWEDVGSNDGSNMPQQRSNLGLFAKAETHGIQTFVELHWGPGFHRYVPQLARFRELVHPLRVQIVDTTDLLLARLLRDPNEIYRLGPERFEELVEDRIAAMGFATRRTGKMRSRDGGVDLLFWDDRAPFPFLGAVQVKYHASPETRTGGPAVREFGGVLASLPPISVGVMVTNTSFTYDARWVAASLATRVRLRESVDLRRWIAGRFVDRDEWREIPVEIELRPGLRIHIPRPA